MPALLLARETWLVGTNMVLGIVVLCFCGAVVAGIAQELYSHAKKALRRKAVIAGLDRELADLYASASAEAWKLK